ncbi:hypothetical protein C8F01DRAFT_1174106 [Mycena amicta]|nr:hypothetical protein C8F01DRAFT_1174106 [Mycena amicta]
MARGLLVAKPTLLSVYPNIQDAFENRKDELHAQIKAFLGLDYVVDVDVRAVWPYVKNRSKRDFRTLLRLYVEGFISALRKYIARYGESGRKCFNRVVIQRKITLSVNPFDIYSDTISAAIRDSVYHILFHPRRFGSAGVVPSDHQNDITIQWLVDRIQLPMNVLDGYSLAARSSIDVGYDLVQVEAARSGLSQILRMEVVLDPNWDEVYAALRASGMPHYYVGSGALFHFTRLCENFRARAELQNDSILKLTEPVIPTRTFKLRVLPQTSQRMVIENGVAFIQVHKAYFNSPWMALLIRNGRARRSMVKSRGIWTVSSSRV